MIDSGRLKTRLAIEAPVEADDGQGGVVRGYAATATVWAAVTPLPARSASAGVEADAEGAAIKVRILLRGNVALTLRHRLVDGARIYRITALRDRDEQRFVEIDAELRVE
jgi:head-tail adaptor